LLTLLKSELHQIKQDYGDPRRTEIRLESVNFDVEQVIKNEQALIFLSADGYVKRVGTKLFSIMERGELGIPSMDLKEQDKVLKVLSARTLQTMMFLTNQGRVYTLKVHEVPETARSARGTPIVNFLQLSDDEKILGGVPIDEFLATQYLTIISRMGTVKRTSLDAFANVRSTGIIAAQFDQNDTLDTAMITNGDGQIALITTDGLTIRFCESDISVMGRTAKGVAGIRLEEGGEIAGACFIPKMQKSPKILLISKKGYGKRISTEEFRLQKRGGSGVLGFNVTTKSGSVIAAVSVTDQDDVIIVSERGQAARLNSCSISLQRRTTAGNRVVRVSDGDSIASLATLRSETTERKLAPKNNSNCMQR
jgi:DNA gyrase subunit A